MSPEPIPSDGLALWGGLECSVARVGDRRHDQLALSGHFARGERDLEAIAALGIRTLRYPILWEHAPLDDDWRLVDRSMNRLRALGITPIVGLLHHGSGPLDTSLVDPSFAERFAQHARTVARRYPWVTAWTPVNEPLTTARFSALYGHWYPHAQDDRSFVIALLHQCIAIVRAMRAIRAEIPDARLVQTDDVGHVSATGPLQYQADFENERRWLGFDLVLGRVGRDHPLRKWLEQAGAPTRALDWLVDHPSAVDVVGINHYLTSDRFLDHRAHLHRGVPLGGNGRHRYVDVEAVRVDLGEPPPGGLAAAMIDTWERYRRPLALSEIHLGGCGEDDRVRWLAEAWRLASAARLAGVDVRAVTSWALFGSFDWQVLLRAETGYYEPGCFDVRSGRLEPTALHDFVRALACAGRCDPPSGPGWWRRADRFIDHRHTPELTCAYS